VCVAVYMEKGKRRVYVDGYVYVKQGWRRAYVYVRTCT